MRAALVARHLFSSGKVESAGLAPNDAPLRAVFYGASLHWELEHFVEAGPAGGAADCVVGTITGISPAELGCEPDEVEPPLTLK